MNTPLVTVGVPLYNHSKYIIECLDSLISQSYKALEIIVVDDGSSDNSFKVAKYFLENQSKNINFQISTRPNKGICNTMNEIALRASGKYISFIGSDDYWMHNKISDQVRYLQRNNDITLVHSCSIRISSDGKKIAVMDYPNKVKEGYLFNELAIRQAKINTSSHLFHRSVFKEIGFYDPTFSFEDTDFWLRLTKLHKVGFINKIHCAYRWHGDNYSKSENYLCFINDELIAVYIKNIQNKSLRNRAIRRTRLSSIKFAILSRDYSRALREFYWLLMT